MRAPFFSELLDCHSADGENIWKCQSTLETLAGTPLLMSSKVWKNPDWVAVQGNVIINVPEEMSQRFAFFTTGFQQYFKYKYIFNQEVFFRLSAAGRALIWLIFELISLPESQNFLILCSSYSSRLKAAQIKKNSNQANYFLFKNRMMQKLQCWGNAWNNIFAALFKGWRKQNGMGRSVMMLMRLRNASVLDAEWSGCLLLKCQVRMNIFSSRFTKKKLRTEATYSDAAGSDGKMNSSFWITSKESEKSFQPEVQT